MLLLHNIKPTKDYNRLSEMLPALKGVAIFMVVIYHIWGYSKGWISFSEISWGNSFKDKLEALLNVICLMGEHGVHLFLIASGFGLAASWWRQQNYPEKFAKNQPIITFWKSRLSRIFPLYWLAHGLAMILALFNPDWVPQSQQLLQGEINAIAAILASLTTLRNIFLEYYFFLNSAWWYIGLAVQLYLIFPLLISLGKRWGWSNLIVSSLLISLVYRGIIISLPLDGKVTDILVRGAFFPSRLFEFVFGIVLAISLLEPQSPQIKHSFHNLYFWSKKLLCEYRWISANAILWGIGLACHWAASAGWNLLRIPADALIGVGEFCLIFQLLNLVPSRQNWLKLLGNYSYGIYLTHMNILRLLWAIFVPVIHFYWLRFGVVFLISCLLGGWFELGYRWLKQRYYPKKASIPQ